MGQAVEVQLLGPVQIRIGDALLPLRGARQQRLVAALALEATRTVTVDRLIDVVWEIDAPATARRQVQDLISRLRMDLVVAGCAESVMAANPSGYSLRVPVDAVDASRFRAQVTAARALRETDPSMAAAMLRSALDLWRDDALAGLVCPALDSARVGLDELRLVAWEQCTGIEINLGRDEDALSDLAALTEAHPTRERLVRLYMHTLYRAGRATDALIAFHRLRARLKADMGLTPGPDVTSMHDAILKEDPALARDGDGPATTTDVPHHPVVPRQLPRDLSDFVGRVANLRALDGLTQSGATVTISTVSGMSGVGKTALATKWAHGALDRFPDGQLYIDLRGYDMNAPMPATEALAHLIGSLGHPADEIPADEQAAASLYRTLMAGRRAIVLLDNARSAVQVRPLLPGSPGSVVIITSRDRLPGLIARDGARLHTLDVLTPAESLDLFRAMLGAARVDAEPAAAVTLATLAGHLPLALRILAAHLSVTPEQSIAALLASFGEHGLLDELTVADDPRASVRTVFDHSYQALTAAQRRLFRMLGVAPGRDITADAADAMLDGTGTHDAGLIGDLVAVHLVDERTPGRFSMHDLVREYAYERAMADETHDARVAAVAGYLDWHIDHARAATGTLFPGATRLSHEAASQVAFPAEDDARAFMDAEIANIVFALRAPRTPRDDLRTCLLADALPMYLWLSDHSVAEWLDVAMIALECAERIDDVRARAIAHVSMGKALDQAHQFEDAIAQHRIAASLGRECGWVDVEMTAAGAIGGCYNSLGRHAEGVDYILVAAAANQRAGRLAAAAANLTNAGIAMMRLGRLRDAASTFSDVVKSTNDAAPRWFRAMMLQNLGMAYHHLGDLDLAETTIDDALAEHLATGQRGSDGEARAYDTLAAIYRDQGRLDLALPAATQALDLLLHQKRGSAASAFNTRGSVLCRLGHIDEAMTHHERALAVATREQIPIPQVEALFGLAAAELAQGDVKNAEGYAERALAVARERGLKVLDGQALTLCAEIAVEMGAWASATRYATEALENHRSTGHAPGERRTRQLLAQLGATAHTG